MGFAAYIKQYNMAVLHVLCKLWLMTPVQWGLFIYLNEITEDYQENLFAQSDGSTRIEKHEPHFVESLADCIYRALWVSNLAECQVFDRQIYHPPLPPPTLTSRELRD